MNDEYWGILNERPIQLLYGQYEQFRQQGSKISVINNDGRNLYSVIDNTAIVEIIGPITAYDDLFNQFFGIPSIEKIKTAIAAALLDNQVSNILLKIDSPGGIATGFSELTDFVFEAREQKKINTWATMCCSAAFFLAAATNKIYTTSMGIMGSIGVIHTQYKPDDDLIVTVSENAPYKNVDASTEKGKNKILSVINDLENTFLERLAKYRQVSKDEIIQNWGQGSEITGAQALQVNMVDGLMGYHELLSSLTRRHLMPTDQTQAASQDAEITFSETQNAQIQQIVQQALEQQAQTHSVQIQQLRDEQKNKDEAESKRKSAIQALFAIFNNEVMYQAQYQELQAQCLADMAVTEDVARQRVIQLRSTLSYQAPASPKTMAAANVPSQIQGEDFQQVVAKFEREGFSRRDAIVRAVKENPGAHEAMIGQHNRGIQIDWTPEKNVGRSQHVH